ncbi:hypothetical protein M1446_04075 [Candidatus Dependentiae bacterium]|nr:hypothetical protein [Candidatus Dependentiae bacterium]
MKKFLFLFTILFCSLVRADLNDFKNPVVEGLIAGYSFGGIEHYVNKKNKKERVMKAFLFCANIVNLFQAGDRIYKDTKSEENLKKLIKIVVALGCAKLGAKIHKDYIFWKMERYLIPFGILYSKNVK